MRSSATETVRESVALSSVISSGTASMAVSWWYMRKSAAAAVSVFRRVLSVDPWPIPNEQYSSNDMTLNFRHSDTQQLEVTISEVILGSDDDEYFTATCLKSLRGQEGLDDLDDIGYASLPGSHDSHFVFPYDHVSASWATALRTTPYQ
ncbi:hypothetical protein EDB83DRAFT_2674892 [Lactarius deliciosus]|nr:hypothetical protein EDB83DRAFT_2674892 [Lactarius deliciosus]